MPDLPKIMIIDDEADLAEVLADYLEGTFACQVCSVPQDALIRLAEERFDLIISDLHMPGVDGFAIITQAVKHQPATPVILLTGSSSSDPDVTKAVAMGAKGVLTKPFSSPNEMVHYLLSFIPATHIR